MFVVDIHAHAIVPAALAEMAAAYPDWGPFLIEDGGRKYLKYPGRERLGPLSDSIFDPGRRLAAMDSQRVDRHIIAIPPPNFHYHIGGQAGIDFARIQNDHLIALCETNPDRFHAFGTLPLQDVAASVTEVGRLAGHPLIRGVQMGTIINGREIDDPEMDSVWAALQSHDLPVWLHPDQRSPFDMAATDPVGGIEAVEMTDADRSAVFSGNAERFLRPLEIG